jgi:hypothetical protein
VDWVDVEFANLRAGFRWAAGQGDLVTAAAIAAHTTMLGFVLLRYEPIAWTEEILDAAAAADLPQLPRLYTAASSCAQTGRAEAAVGYAQMARAVAADPRYDPFEPGCRGGWEVGANVYAGRMDEAMEVLTGLVGQPGSAQVVRLL